MTAIATAFLAVTATATAAPEPLRGQGPALYDSRCDQAYRAVRYYRGKYDTFRRELGYTLAPKLEQAMDCRRLKQRVRYWRTAAKINRLAAKHDERTLQSTRSWRTAIEEVQPAFPDTSSWLWSCSGAEGGHGRWVRYGGGAYTLGTEHSQTFHGDMVGGWLQYMWGTFKGHYRHGLESLRSRGFRVKLPPPSDVRAWLDPLAQAIAGGWARWSGNDASHWSASWGNGC